MSQKDQILHFHNGLQSRTVDEIIMKRPNTLSEAIEIANCYEQKYKYHLNEDRRDIRTFKPNRPSFNGNVNKPPWSPAKPSNPPSTYNTARDNQQKTCFSCKGIGHFSKQCPKRTKQQPGGGSNNSFQQSVERKPFFKQPERPKPARTYVVTTNSRPDELIKVSGQIQDKNCTFVLDGGATSSILSKRLVDKYKWKTFETQSTIQTADSGPPVNVQRTEKIRLEIHGVLYDRDKW